MASSRIGNCAALQCVRGALPTWGVVSLVVADQSVISAFSAAEAAFWGSPTPALSPPYNWPCGPRCCRNRSWACSTWATSPPPPPCPSAFCPTTSRASTAIGVAVEVFQVMGYHSDILRVHCRFVGRSLWGSRPGFPVWCAVSSVLPFLSSIPFLSPAIAKHCSGNNFQCSGA